jgi:hypothetical protein
MSGLEDAVDELYGLPVADFTARRNELARATRAAKDRATATAITALKKPAVHVWLANRLARPAAGRVPPAGHGP